VGPTIELTRRSAGAAVASIGVLALLGWATGIDELRAVHASYTPMVPWTAVAFVLLGVALGRRDTGRSWLLGVGAGVVGGVHLLQVLAGERVWPVAALFRDQVRAVSPGRPGEMAPLTATLLIASAIALVARPRGFRRTWLAATAVTLVGAALAAIGYVYGVSTLYDVGEYTAMALPTALAFGVVAVGLGADRDNPLVSCWADDGPAGWLVRHTLPLVLAVPPLVGGLQLVLTRNGAYDVELGLASIAISWMVLDVVALLVSARQLRHLDEDREVAWDEVVAGRRRHLDEARKSDAEATGAPAAIGTMRVDAASGELWADPDLLRLAGASSSRDWLARVHVEDRTEVEQAIRRAAGSRTSVELAFRFLHDGGGVVHVRGACGPDAHGWSCAFADVTAEVEAREAAALVEASFRSSPIGTAIVDGDGRIVESNAALAVLVRAQPGELDGRPLVDCFDQGDRLVLAQMLDAQNARADLRVVPFDGTGLWADVNVSPIPGTGRSLVSFIDVTDRHEAEERLTQQARRDPLTGLPNRIYVHERLADALARSERSHRPVAVLFCDLDAFKVVNDSLGHETGDRVLVEAALRLRHAVRPFDVVGRMGGDEFVVVCEDADEDLATSLADRIKQRLLEPLVAHGHHITIGASIGIALSSAGSSGHDMIRDADTAMYRAKNRGRNRYEIFDGGLREGAVRRFQLEQELRCGIDGPEFGVGYEAVVAVATGTVVGAEALLRWHQPDGTPIPPVELLPIAEESGLIRPLGDRVLVDALRSVATWRSAGLDVWVAVNVSAKQLGGHDFADVVERALEVTGVPAASLVLEITESALSDIPDSAARDLQCLRGLGVRLAIDDFGTGWSSLERLRTLEADILKIDRVFVAGLGTDNVDQSIVRGLIELAQRVGLTTVAEGVETAEQLDALMAYGCDLAQGYLLHRCGPAGDIEAMAARASSDPAD
jgi:diguanylate cyclase (GGDEF)-like protein/PAS domain S-box-containing protein